MSKKQAKWAGDNQEDSWEALSPMTSEMATEN